MDETDLRIITDVRLGTGPSSVSGLKTSADDAEGYSEESTASPCADSDADGMPNAWELSEGLNPNDPTDGPTDLDQDGFTQLEEFLNGTQPNKANNNTEVVWVTMTTEGAVTGFVVASPPGFTCGADCASLGYHTDQAVTLTALGETFSAWSSGPCTGSDDPVCRFAATCSFELNGVTEVRGNLSHGYRVRAKGIGTGTGSFEFAPDGFVDLCGSDCRFFAASQATLAVDAVPDPGSTFVKWTTGGCQLLNAISPTCPNLTNTKTRLLKAEFALD